MSNVTQLIDSVRNGEVGASDSLLSAVYDELHEMAQVHFSKEKSGHTLQTTALVNEAFLRLFGSETNPNWQNRAHFFGAAAEAMRRILVDHARTKRALKRGGSNQSRRNLDEICIGETDVEEIIDINDALTLFTHDYPQKAQLVKLRYFGGLSIAQAAQVMQISIPTANRYWAFAKAWLFNRIQSN